MTTMPAETQGETEAAAVRAWTEGRVGEKAEC